MNKKEQLLKNKNVTESSLSSSNSGNSSKSNKVVELLHQSSTSLPVELIRPSRKDEYLNNMTSKATFHSHLSDNHINGKGLSPASSLSLYKKSLMSEISMDIENLDDYNDINEYDNEKESKNSSFICDIFNLNSKLPKPFRLSNSNNNSEQSSSRSSQSPSLSIKSDLNNRISFKKKKDKKYIDNLLINNQKHYQSDNLITQSTFVNNKKSNSNKDLLKINNKNDHNNNNNNYNNDKSHEIFSSKNNVDKPKKKKLFSRFRSAPKNTSNQQVLSNKNKSKDINKYDSKLVESRNKSESDLIMKKLISNQANVGDYYSDDNQGEASLYKQAVYSKQYIPRDAIRVNLNQNNFSVANSNKFLSNRDLNSQNEKMNHQAYKLYSDSSNDRSQIKLNNNSNNIGASKNPKLVRRNTLSKIEINKTNTTLLQQQQQQPKKYTAKMLANEIAELNQKDIFDIIELEDNEALAKKLAFNSSSINNFNYLDFTPLDLALMLNNKILIHTLLENGAIENQTLINWADRYEKICNKLILLDEDLKNFLSNLDVVSVNSTQIKDYDARLTSLDRSIKFLNKLKSIYESIEYPGQVENIQAEISGPSSIAVHFDEPVKLTKGFIIKYLVEWSFNLDFDPLEGSQVLTYLDDSRKKFNIEGLIQYQTYYIRVSCANIRGYGPCSLSNPPFLTLNYWRNGDSIEEIQARQYTDLIELEKSINQSKLNSEFLEMNEFQIYSNNKHAKKGHGFKKNLKTLITFALTHPSNQNLLKVNSKFVKELKKCSAYLVTIFYDQDRILTTSDDNLPIIEIDENYSFQTINSDLQFLLKLSLNWNEIESYKGLIEKAINTHTLRFKFLILSAIKRMQNLLQKDLGKVYYQYFKSSNGCVFFITVKNFKNIPSEFSIPQNIKINEIEKLLAKCNSSITKSNSSNSLTKNIDHGYLIKHIRMISEFDDCSAKILSRGLYISYLKVQSSIELVKVMVKSNMPSILPSYKLRDNPNVTEEEWKFLKSLKHDPKSIDEFEVNSQNFEFIKLIYKTIKFMCKDLEISDLEMAQLRLIVSQIIEINSDICLILICPPAEQICITSNTDENIQSKKESPSSFGDNNKSNNNLRPLNYQNLKANSNSALSFLKSNEFIYLPVQIFEALNLISYDLKFIKLYVKLSVILDIEYQTSTQLNREAFSNDEINNSKRILNLVTTYQKKLEDVWKKSRWMIETINIARDKATISYVVPLINLEKFLNKFDYISHNLNELEKKQLDLKNIYNEISKLPYQLDSNRMSECMPDSPLRQFCINSLNQVKKPQNLKDSAIDKKKNYSLLSKIYISPIESPSSPYKISTFNQNNNSEFFFDYKPKSLNNTHLSSPDTSVSSSISYPSTSESSNYSTISKSHKCSLYDRNIIVNINFNTGLKIDLNFECFFNNQTTCKDIIRNILKRINSFKETYQRINNGDDTHYSIINEMTNSNEDDELLTFKKISSEDLDKIFENAYDDDSNCIKLLDEDADLYYLFVVLDELRVKILMNDFKIATLVEPWSKGDFYIKKKL